MRVLHVTDHFPPTLGGIETHVSTLAERQAEHGHDVTVLTFDRPGGTEPSRYRLVRARSGHDLPPDLGGVDIVHAHVSVVAPFTAPVAARLARSGVPTVVTVHSMWSGAGPVAGLAARASGLTQAPVAWTAVSRVAADLVAARLPAVADGRPARVDVLPNAVDAVPRPAPARRPGPVQLVTAMRLARRKRPLALVGLLAELRRSCAAEVRLTVLGDGPMTGRLERALRRRGLEALVSMSGRVLPAEVRQVVADADVYLAPARLESFGLAALEARALGLPVVGFAGSGLTEFVDHGVHGFLADSDRSFAACVARLVDDADLRARIAETNRTSPAGFTWPDAVRAHDRCYARVVAGASAPALVGG